MQMGTHITERVLQWLHHRKGVGGLPRSLELDTESAGCNCGKPNGSKVSRTCPSWWAGHHPLAMSTPECDKHLGVPGLMPRRCKLAAVGASVMSVKQHLVQAGLTLVAVLVFVWYLSQLSW